jgi:hypothetical protein
MPRIDPELRARQCKFTYSDGRRCRLAHSPKGNGYCYSHARKILEARKSEYVHALLTEPLSHPAVSSTALSLVLARLFSVVSCGRLPAKTANSLLRITQALQKTLPSTTHEFSQVFDRRALTDTIRLLYQEQEDFLKYDQEDPAVVEDITGYHAAMAALAQPPATPTEPPAPPTSPSSGAVPPSSTAPPPDSAPRLSASSDLSSYALSGKPNPYANMPLDELFRQIKQIYPTGQSRVPK